MDPKLQSKLDQDRAAIGQDEAFVNAAIEAQVLDIHTAIPGSIVSFDPATQTCEAQPGIQRIFRELGPVDLPRLVDVPVQFPRGGDFVLTFPVKAGDECLLIFSERAIDGWYAKGGSQPPSEYRTHDLSDACAVLGISSKPRAVPAFSTNAVELRRYDGTAKVSIDGGKNINVTTTGSGNITCETQAGDIACKPGLGRVLLNAPQGANPFQNGVVISMDPCPILGKTHAEIGCGAARVLAGKT
jgi:hypothetical protein